MSELGPIMNSEEFHFLMEAMKEDQIIPVPEYPPEEDPIPAEYDTIPSDEHLSGIYNFDVFIPPSKSLVYSSKLEKIFIKMSNDFTVHFKWDNQYQNELKVRAKPRFCSHEDANKAVRRCLQHSHDEDHSNKALTNSSIRHHILRCKNSQAKYEGGLDQHFSVYVPLSCPEAGSDFIPHTYQFVCQNSCASGMNRRPIEVIFTLEDMSGEVYGRKAMNVRICSCPKRDKEKEEAEVKDGQPPPGKRRKSLKRAHTPVKVENEENDISVHSVTINVFGIHNKKKLLKYAFDIHSGDMLLQPNNQHLIKPLLEDIHNAFSIS